MCVGQFGESGSTGKGGAGNSPQGREGTKNKKGRVTCPTPTANTPCSSHKSETNVKMKKICPVGQ